MAIATPPTLPSVSHGVAFLGESLTWLARRISEFSHYGRMTLVVVVGHEFHYCTLEVGLDASKEI